MARYIKFIAHLTADNMSQWDEGNWEAYVQAHLTYGDKHQEDSFFGVTVVEAREES